ncbi:MAG TPA: hypothetical protein VK453_14935 [Micromonosporaceae bacterium]|nr:hypothetical protein [Micromonosporaceae bacterium]
MDARAKHLRRLRHLRRSARGWSIRAGLLAGAAGVLVPYEGLGLPDAGWAAAAGGAVALTVWRWVDLRAFAALPVPPEPDPALAGAQARERLLTAVAKVPGGRAVIDEYDRQRTRVRLRGLTVAEPWRRLDRAALTLSGLAGRLGGPARTAVAEAAVAERSLRELAERAACVERALVVTPADARAPLTEAHAVLVKQLHEGVTAYERLVAAAAGYLAEDTRASAPQSAASRLTEAADLLRGIAAGLSELRRA